MVDNVSMKWFWRVMLQCFFVLLYIYGMVLIVKCYNINKVFIVVGIITFTNSPDRARV